MKVRLNITVEVPEEYRKALAQRYGADRLPTRASLRSHFMHFGMSIDDDILDEAGMELLEKYYPIWRTVR